MVDPFTAWSRLVSASLDFAVAGQRAAETMVASHAVMTARGDIIKTAMQTPHRADNAELARMLPEKMEAFAQAGSVVATGLWAMQLDFLRQAERLGALSLKGRPPTQGELSQMASKSVSHTLRTMERAAALGADAMAPIHASATSNARRLSRKKAR